MKALERHRPHRNLPQVVGPHARNHALQSRQQPDNKKPAGSVSHRLGFRVQWSGFRCLRKWTNCLIFLIEPGMVSLFCHFPIEFNSVFRGCFFLRICHSLSKTWKGFAPGGILMTPIFESTGWSHKFDLSIGLSSNPAYLMLTRMPSLCSYALLTNSPSP